MREKLDKDCSSFFFDGITPACAGKTYCWLVPVGSRLGSPPRVREKLIVLITEKKPVGITPACAGKTNFKDIFLFNGWDHPRVCGKNLLTRRTRNSCPGSPPRVREKPCVVLPLPLWIGITPACAGKTEYDDVLKEITRDHPRVCGKNSNRWMSVHPPEGSPPRVREKHGNFTALHNANGITPACAGKTKLQGYQLRRYWDHPRVCGKNSLTTSTCHSS